MTLRQKPRDESYPDPREVEREFARLHAEREEKKPISKWDAAGFYLLLVVLAFVLAHFVPFGV